MGNCLVVDVRVFKSGSLSLTRLLAQAFAGSRTFYLPTIIDRDGAISRFQRLRFRRTLARNLYRRYRTTDLDAVFAHIASEARDGDLIDGGHIDYPTAAAGLGRPARLITILRDPVARAWSEYNYARESLAKKNLLSRIDAGLLPKMAARYDFENFLDFQLDHEGVYGNVACRFTGWDGSEDLAAFFARAVFHAGTLEENERFAHGLSEKMGKPLAFPHENRTGSGNAPAVTAAARAKIERLYVNDFTLYAWVREHL